MYVSVRDYGALEVSGFIGKEGNIIEAMSYLGLDAVELEYFHDDCVYSLKGGEKINLGQVKEREILKEELSNNNLKISSFLMHNNFADEDLKGQIDWIMKCIDSAEYFNVSAIRIDPVIRVEREVSTGEVLDGAVKALRAVFDRVEKEKKVYLAMENHGNHGNRPEFLRKVIDEVGDERLGVCLDSGNFYWYGFPIDQVYKIFEEFAPLVRHTHIKNIKYPDEIRNKQREIGYKYGEYVSPIYEGDIEHGKFIKILENAGYDGDICIEDESLGKYSKEDALLIMKRDVSHLKQLLS